MVQIAQSYTNPDENPPPRQTKKLPIVAPAPQQRLLELARSALSMVSPVWSFSAQDWVTSVHATDIDDDGDIEIIAGSRDGYVYVLTKWGSQKWRTSLGARQWISTVVGVPQRTDLGLNVASPRIIAGSRDGKVYALNASGTVLPAWQYQSGDVIRQVYINQQDPEHILVASEDGFIHVLDYETGNLCWKEAVGGSVQSVLSCDIDGDGKLEILAASANKHVYIFDREGQRKGSFETEQKIYTLSAAPIGPKGQMTILTSYQGKDLCGWTAQPQRDEDELILKRMWPNGTQCMLFKNRVYSIFATYLNKIEKKDEKDNTAKFPEILVGSEDEHLYILDHQGNLLWKHHLKSCVYSVYALDINLDGIMEVIVGLADNTVQVLRIELIPDLYAQITSLAHSVGNARIKSLLSQGDNVSILLRDLLNEEGGQRYRKMEMNYALYKLGDRSWETALALFLKLRQQRVQHYWPQPNNKLGPISTMSLADVAGNDIDEIMVGNTRGTISALDIENDKRHLLWNLQIDKPVLMLQCGSTDLDKNYDTTMAVLADRRVCAINNKGKVQKWLEFPDKDDRVLCLYINAQGDRAQHPIREVLFGLENKKIYVYDAQLEQLQWTISTPQGINKIFTHDLTGPGTGEIIASSLDHRVYVYSRDQKLRWQFQAEDRIRALCAKDIDQDGQDEILVGSEDRNVYVLDHNGNLKWRYYTPHRVLAVDAYDINQDGKYEVLVGVADGYMYVLNNDGDLLWTFKASERVRAVIAGDLKKDGGVEIVLASEEQLYLLQMVNREQLDKCIKQCWEAILGGIPNFDNHKAGIIKLLQHENEYIRAEALTRLAGTSNLTANDRRYLQKALKDPSLQVKMALARVIVNRFMVDKDDPENVRLLRLLLQQLTADPDRDVRLSLITALPRLTKFDPALCFEHLERFVPNVDLWIRRSVVRKLHHLTEDYPKQTFRLLLKTVQDQEIWIRQETGRSLAHYFDLHLQQELIVGLHKMLEQHVDIAVFQVIANCAREPLVQKLFQAVHKLYSLKGEEEKELEETLQKAIEVLEAIADREIPYGEDTCMLYQELYQLLQTKNIDDIVQYRRVTDTSQLQQIARFKDVAEILDSFVKVVKALQIYQRREGLGDRAASLIEVMTVIYEIRQMPQFHIAPPHLPIAGETITAPEYRVLHILLQRWHSIVLTQLRGLRGVATLGPQIRTSAYQQDSQVDVSLEITNTGRSPADNVSIKLETGEDYEIIGRNCCHHEEISTVKPSTTEFRIKPHTDSPRLLFSITYDDAERRRKHLPYADKIALRTYKSEFREIPNHYHSGTPIIRSEDEMFFGRQDNLKDLSIQLTDEAENRVVVLTGQRRSGKTSLIYQLANDSSWLHPHIPVFIELQDLVLSSNVNQLLAGFARQIHKALKAQEIQVPKLEPEQFADNPTEIFNNYLQQAIHKLAGSRLILLIDEFETLEDMIRDHKIGTDFLQYLRSLMQHRQGITFLLAGAPSIRHRTAEYWSVFFNIARHHALSKLKAEDAKLLITSPVDGYLEYDPLALEKIHQLTGDQPYLIHIMAESLIRYCNTERRRYVTINEVNKTLDMVLETGTNHFGWIWSHSSPLEHLLLSALSQEKGYEGRIFSLADIKEMFDEYSLSFEREAVIRALTHLAQEDFIEQRQSSTQFRIPVGLTRAWLRLEKPLERVVREENPQRFL